MKLMKWGSLILLGLIVALIIVIFSAFLILKTIAFLVIVLIINLMFKEKEETLRAVAKNKEGIITRFKIKNLLKFLLSWVIYFTITFFVLKGAYFSFFTEALTCLIQVYASFSYTRNGYKRIVENYFTGRIDMVFPEGLMFYPGIWFFYKVSTPLRVVFSEKDNSFTFIEENNDVVKDSEGGSKIHINIDTKDVLRTRKITGIEDLIYTTLVNNPVFRRKILEFDIRRFISSVFLTIIIMLFSFFSIKFFKNSYSFFKNQNYEINLNLKERVTSFSKSVKNFFTFKKDDQDDFQENKVNMREANEKVDTAVLDPLYKFDSLKYIWDLKSVDDHTVVCDIPKDVSFIEEKGLVSYESENFYPKVYLEGYPFEDNYFAMLFRVKIDSLIFRDIKKPMENIFMDLEDYINLLKTKRILYRKMTVFFKEGTAGYVSWHYITSGIGIKDYPFEVRYGEREIRMSLAERKRLRKL